MACRATRFESTSRFQLRSRGASLHPVGATTALVLAFVGGCAGKDTPQEPISENLAPAVASPATEAFVPMGVGAGGLSSTESTDPLNPATTAPLTVPATEDDEDFRENPDGTRTTRHTFVPKVSRTTTARMAPVPGERPAPTATAGLTDGQILRVAETMHETELAEASIVEERAQGARVKEFAKRVREDSAQLKERTQELAKSARLTPRESPLSADLRAKASQELTDVELARPEEFDEAFLESQVEQNAELLELIDSRLIPSATEPALKNELSRSRAVLERQTEEAREIQRSLQMQQGEP